MQDVSQLLSRCWCVCMLIDACVRRVRVRARGVLHQLVFASSPVCVCYDGVASSITSVCDHTHAQDVLVGALAGRSVRVAWCQHLVQMPLPLGVFFNPCLS